MSEDLRGVIILRLPVEQDDSSGKDDIRMPVGSGFDGTLAFFWSESLGHWVRGGGSL